MNYALARINPFYAARLKSSATPAQHEPPKPVYARLPLAPSNALGRYPGFAYFGQVALFLSNLSLDARGLSNPGS